MEDFVERPTPYPSLVKSGELSALMCIPIEVRSKILGHLLPNVLEIQPWFSEFYRSTRDRCHTSVLRANHQLYTEGTAILYNRAFRMHLTTVGPSFLKHTYIGVCEIQKPMAKEFNFMSGSVMTIPNPMLDFPFHRAKQLQIELWLDHFRYDLLRFRACLIEVCSILYRQPGFKNIRVDFYDRSYRPSSPDRQRLFDDDEAHPAQDKYDGKMSIRKEGEEYYATKGGVMVHRIEPYRPWERRSEIVACHQARFDKITDLELVLQPLKLLRSVRVARINLPQEAENDEEMRRLSRECEEGMMSCGPRDESEIAFMEWCTDPSEPWDLESLFG